MKVEGTEEIKKRNLEKNNFKHLNLLVNNVLSREIVRAIRCSAWSLTNTTEKLHLQNENLGLVLNPSYSQSEYLHSIFQSKPISNIFC